MTNKLPFILALLAGLCIGLLPLPEWEVTAYAIAEVTGIVLPGYPTDL